jgi:hypothetical protein
LKDIPSKGHPPRLTADNLAALAAIVETGPARATDGVVRWRRIDLKRVIEERFGVVYHERTVGELLNQIGFSHISARPRHPAQKAETIDAFKTYGPPVCNGIFESADDRSAAAYPASEDSSQPRWRYVRSGPNTPAWPSRRYAVFHPWHERRH